MPTQETLAELLPGNACFGCGAANPAGLRITVDRDPDDAGRIVGTFLPRDHMIGFPGITHGGAIYTALDCMATWAGMVLRGTKAIWILRAATMKYHRPASPGVPISLSASIEEQGGEWDAIVVRAEARDAERKLLAEGRFKVIPLPPERFQSMTGNETLPESWRRWLGV